MTKLTKEELKQIKDLALEIKNQDPEGKRWGTAEPLQFWLQDIEEEQEKINDPEHYIYSLNGDYYYKGKNAEEIFQELKDDYEFYEDESEQDKIDEIENEMIGVKTRYDTKRVFLTYKAAEKHLKQNYYHYSSRARIYCHHAWRNPEAELVHKLILSFLEEGESENNIHHKAEDQIIYELAKSLMELTEKYIAHGANNPILSELGLLKTHSTDKGISFSWKLNWENLERLKGVGDE